MGGDTHQEAAGRGREAPWQEPGALRNRERNTRGYPADDRTGQPWSRIESALIETYKVPPLWTGRKGKDVSLGRKEGTGLQATDLLRVPVLVAGVHVVAEEEREEWRGDQRTLAIALNTRAVKKTYLPETWA